MEYTKITNFQSSRWHLFTNVFIFEDLLYLIWEKSREEWLNKTNYWFNQGMCFFNESAITERRQLKTNYAKWEYGHLLNIKGYAHTVDKNARYFKSLSLYLIS